MDRSRWWRAAALTGLVLLLLPAADAHPRGYVALSGSVHTTCLDGDGLPPTLGGLVAAIDPLVPDTGGSCWRRGHITPNLNGETTFSIHDSLETNVGGEVCQDQNHDNDCGDITDFRVPVCNERTVSRAEGWDPVRFDTFLFVDDVVAGSALLQSISIIGGAGPCGPGVDTFGTIGNVDHS